MATILTPQGYQALKEKLARLLRRRKKLVEEMELARQEGDLAENSAYHQLRESVALLGQQIENLQEQLSGAKVIARSKNNRQVEIGSRVTVAVAGRQRVLEIVGDGEGNPLQGQISYRSPLGRQLLGKKIGEVVVVTTPRGEVNYRIVTIQPIG